MAHLLLAILLGAAEPDTLEAVSTTAAPTLDGDASDACWGAAPQALIRVQRAAHPGEGRYEVALKAVFTNDTVCLLASWPDETESAANEPYRWNAQENRYDVSEEHEDAFSVAFPLRGRFTADMYSPDEAVWDVWQWGASRTNPTGFALDRTHTMTLRRPRGGAGVRVTARNNADLWILRSEDRGTTCYDRAPVPTSHTEDTVPQFRPRAPTGSAADVHACGRHDAGRWTVEFSRALNTRANDDAPFNPAQPISFAIATFDAEEDLDHRVSTALTLRFRR